MKKIVKWILLAIILIASIAGGIYYKNMPLPVSMTIIEPKEAELNFIEQGVVVAKRVVDIYALHGGEITELNVEEGQQINKGDVICSIDSSEYTFSIKQMESNIKGYQAQINNLALEEKKQKDSLISNKNSLLGELASIEAQERSSYATASEQLRARNEQVRLQSLVAEQSEANVNRAAAELEKAKILYEGGIMSQNDYDAVAKVLEDSESALQQSRQQLEIIASSDITNAAAQFAGLKESLQAQISGIDSSLEKSYTGAMSQYYQALIEGSLVNIEQLNKRIEDSTILSPVSGIITKLAIKDTNTVSPGIPIAAVTTDTTNQIEVYVSTKDIDGIVPGKKVELILDRRMGDKVFAGEVLYTDDEATTKLSALGVEERRVKVTIAPENTSDLKPGYDVDVKFIYYQEQNKLTVPKTALFIENDKDMIWLVKEGIARKTEVEKGIELRTEIVIEKGIASSDMVVTDADLAGLRDGVKVVSE